jgi:hypothetical protein
MSPLSAVFDGQIRFFQKILQNIPYRHQSLLQHLARHAKPDFVVMFIGF